MKLKKIEFNNHKIFNNLEVDFCDDNKEPLDIIVLIGENGSGKTTLLRDTFDALQIDERGYNYISDEEVYLNNGDCSIFVKTEKNEIDMLHPDCHIVNEIESSHPKIVYMPTEINFKELNKVDNTFKFTPDFYNIIDQNMTRNIPSLIATKINQEIFKNRKRVIEEVINEVCENINKIFDCLDLEVKLVGLSENYETKPIFKNSLGKEFDINGLSSGEKQLFLRALSLNFLEVNNSIILIDEPEISLHPKWQQKIIKVYENIGENNQLIIATHSPHVVGNIEAKNLRIMKKDKNGISMINKESEPEFLLQYKRKNPPKTWTDYDKEIKNIIKEFIIKNEQNQYCAYCQRTIYSNDEAHIEHIKPRDKFPKLFQEYNNIIVSCNDKHTCGMNKGNEYDEKLINPVLDNPNEYLDFNLASGEIIPKSTQ